MRYIKISSAGEQLPEGSTATDHVAVLLPDQNLMFSVGKPIEGEVTQHQAVEACKKFDLLGFNDWRCPERAELLLLVDDTKHDPAINTDAFPGTKSDWYWTNTAYAGSPSDGAWLVSFGGGDSSVDYRDNFNGFVRAVRSVAPSGQ